MDFNYNGYIELRKDTTNMWGPFEFDFTDSLPEASIVSGVTTEVFVGNINTQSYTGSELDINDLVVETTALQWTDKKASVYFQYPGDIYRGDILTLKLNVFLTSVETQTPQYPLYFPFIRVV